MTVHSFWQQTLAEQALTTRKLSRLLFGPDGVREDAGSPGLVQAKATPDMTLTVNPAWCKSGEYMAYNDAVATVTITTADALLPRTDLVVMRWYDTENGDGSSFAQLEVLKGTPNANPQPPSLTGKVVCVLAQVAVAAATTSISGSAVTDKRVIVTSSGFPRMQYEQGTVGQAMTNNVFTKLTNMTVKDVDYFPAGSFNTATGVWTCPAGGGRFKISGQVTVTDGAARTVVAIFKNGAVLYSSYGGAGLTNISAQLPEKEFTLAAGETIDLRCSSNAAGITTDNPNGATSFLRIEQVGY